MILTKEQITFTTLKLINKIKTMAPEEVLPLTAMELRVIALAPETFLPSIFAKNISAFSTISQIFKQTKFILFDKRPDSKQFKHYNTAKGEAIRLGLSNIKNSTDFAFWFIVSENDGCTYADEIKNEEELDKYLVIQSPDTPKDTRDLIPIIYDLFVNHDFEITENDNSLKNLLTNKNIRLFLSFIAFDLVTPEIYQKNGIAYSNKSTIVDLILADPDMIWRKYWIEQFLDEKSQLGILLRQPRIIRDTKETRGNFKKLINAYQAYFSSELFPLALERAKAGTPLPLPTPPMDDAPPPYVEPSSYILASAPEFMPVPPEIDKEDLDPYCLLQEREEENGKAEVIEATDSEIAIAITNSQEYPNIAQAAKDQNEHALEKYIAKACPPLNYSEIGMRLYKLMEEEKEKIRRAKPLIDDDTEVANFNHNFKKEALTADPVIEETISQPSKADLFNKLSTLKAPHSQLFVPEVEEVEEPLKPKQTKIALAL